MHKPSSDVTLRELSGIAELSAGARLIREVFGAHEGEPVPADLLVAVSLSGGYVGGAFIAGDLVGVAVGFGEVAAPGAAPSSSMHSHVAAVAQTARGRRIGWSLKMHQRTWALARGITTIEWTYDPLVRRNAHLNLTLLGARGVRYLPNLYGEIPDALNAGQESDRLLVRWVLGSPETLAAVAGSPRVPDGAARPERPGHPARAARLTCPTPPDIEALLRTDPDAARAWRARQRAVLEPALAGGASVVGITRAGDYLLEGPADAAADAAAAGASAVAVVAKEARP